MFGTACWRFFYTAGLKPYLFQKDPEDVHQRMTLLGELLGRSRLGRWFVGFFFRFSHPSLEQTVVGIRFSNPIGLAAGFDKDGRLVDILPEVGFGFAEVGSITGESCLGNPKPRLWRLPKSRGLVVNYGLKNDGCEVVSRRLAKRVFRFPIGISVAKTNASGTVDVEAGIADYVKAFRAFAEIGDYLTVNISCPNAFGGEPFTDPQRLELLLVALDAIPTLHPVFLKMPADLTEAALQALLEVARRHRIHGIIFVNLTKRYDRSTIDQEERSSIMIGGVSGKPVTEDANRLVAWAYRLYGSRFVYIGCGGVFSAKDAYEKILQGASLVQLITGMIYEGPQLIGEINRELARLIERDGFKSVADAVGAAHRAI